ncbi:hypothetical protein BYT27DRAFT_7226523 [Phlegmacium glaucopus]|nr:hypothetical protein BYT27DRAFT_7226523 [Phlegmacium glaucopus]
MSQTSTAMSQASTSAIDKHPHEISNFGTLSKGPKSTVLNNEPSFSPPSKPATSDSTSKLIDDKKRIERALERAKKSLPPIETYLGFLKIEPLDATALREAVKSYETAAKELDDLDANLNLKASIGLFAESDCKDEKISLIYAVTSATWNAEYDIHVDTTSIRGPVVTLTYKANITQKTGEVRIGIKSCSCSKLLSPFCLEVPRLTPWKFATHRERPKTVQNSSAKCSTSTSISIPGKTSSHRIQWKKHRGPLESSNEPNMKSNLGDNFKVPGLISIESDGITHNQTIAKERLEAKMSWVCVPKKDTKTHLNAKIKNASPYTFLSGQASVYVDGSFISKSDVPLVSPEESFDCPLGVDPSIRVIYHPRSKKISQSGFYTKTTNYVFSQRITVSNTKTLAIENLKIIDQAPVSEDSDITVKLVSPALGIPGEGFGGGTIGELKAPPPLRVASGVIAQWHGADEAGVEVEALGKDGKLNWVCAVPAQEKIGLVLQWEVMAPAKTAIVGLPV